MPMHDWTQVKAGTYHNFHYRWIAAIMDRLNAGLLPTGFFAMAEQFIGGPQTDVVALRSSSRVPSPSPSSGGVSVTTTRPAAKFVLSMMSESERYARKAHYLAIHHELGNVVAVIEVVSPGNKDRRHSLQTFVSKAVGLLEQQINLLLIDPFPPGPHDPHGLPQAICQEFVDTSVLLTPDKPLTVTSFQAEPQRMAYLEPLAVGDPLPAMPLFLEGELYISLPLEETYQATWQVLPQEIRQLLESAAS